MTARNLTKNRFWYRISLPYRKRLFFAPRAFENASRTPGAPLRYSASIPYTRRPSQVPNATSAKRRKTLPAHEFLKLPEKRRPLQKAQPGMPPQARKSQPKSLQCRPKVTQCHSEKPLCPKTTQCHSEKPLSPKTTQCHSESPTLHRYLNQKSRSAKLTGFLVVGRRIELLLRD